MNSPDYLLYDNVTLDQNGKTDYGLKVSTGIFRDRKDLRRHFFDYVDLVKAESGAGVSALDSTIGGFTDNKKDVCYVLCISIAIKDASSRPALATIGFLYQRQKLRESLQRKDDYIEMAKSALQQAGKPFTITSTESIPASEVLTSQKKQAWERLKKIHSNKLKPLVVDGQQSKLLSLAILRKMVYDTNQDLFSIHGGTSLFTPRAWQGIDYAIIFCFACTEREQSALINYIEEQKNKISSWSENTPLETKDKPKRHFFIPKIIVFCSALTIILVLAAIFVPLYSMFPKSPQPEVVATMWQPLLATSTKTANLIKITSTDLSYLQEVKSLLADIKILDKKVLRSDEVYKTAHDLLLSIKYEEKQINIINEQEILADWPDAIIGALDYYFDADADGEKLPTELKVKKVREYLSDFALSSADCTQTKEAFGYWFMQTETVFVKWCNQVDKLSLLAKR